jgi:hypothetical protein
VAVACRLAIEARGLEDKYEIIGTGCLDGNLTKYTSKELIKIYNWDKVPLKRELKGREPLLDFSKAKKLLGFKSKFNWWEMYGKDVV